jgi:hypothetical protein
MPKRPETINIPVWWSKGGGMMVRRDCLPFDHPEHPYNYIRDQLNLNPEDYGIFPPPQAVICPKCGHHFITKGGDNK